MLAALNAERETAGAPTLALSPPLLRAARWKAAALAATGVHELTERDHDDADRTWVQRILDCGYSPTASFGENLAITQTVGPPAATGESEGDDRRAEQLVDRWQETPGTGSNLLNPAWHFAGLAVVEVGTTHYWVVVFGTDPR